MTGSRPCAASLSVVATVVARSSQYALYDEALAGFGESGSFSQQASPGFIELFTLQSRLAHRVRGRGAG